jgi:four helix bundle protein
MSDVWQNNTILLKADLLAHEIYKITNSFPKTELYGVTSQLRRAALSVPLNIIEGYSRFKIKPHINFLEIAYGSLKETHYLIDFCVKEKFIKDSDYDELLNLCVEIEKMLYSKIKTLKKNAKR